jgi:hypothetical protein
LNPAWDVIQDLVATKLSPRHSPSRKWRVTPLAGRNRKARNRDFALARVYD